MSFADGESEIKVGQEVVYSNGQMGRHYKLEESTVGKIGNKLVTLKNMDQFFLGSGSMETIYVSGRLYSSKEAYNIDVARSKLIHEVEMKLRNSRLTYEQAVKIAEIIK